jgi:hypothetical protein
VSAARILTVSDVAVWRTLTALTRKSLTHMTGARTGRKTAWGLGAATGLDPHSDVINVDETLVTACSDKEGAPPTYQHG